MTADEAIAIFASYSSDEKEKFLAQLLYEMTLIARELRGGRRRVE